MEKSVIFNGLQSSESGWDCRLIREKVFVQEQGFREEFDTIDETAFFTVIYIDDMPAATGRCFPDKNVTGLFVLGRIAVLPEYRKLGLGKKVMDLLEEIAYNNNAAYTKVSSQLQAKGFYERCGYTAEGDMYYDEHCPHIKMIKRLSKSIQ